MSRRLFAVIKHIKLEWVANFALNQSCYFEVFSVCTTYFLKLQINLQVNQWLTWLETAEEEESEEEAD